MLAGGGSLYADAFDILMDGIESSFLAAGLQDRHRMTKLHIELSVQAWSRVRGYGQQEFQTET